MSISRINQSVAAYTQSALESEAPARSTPRALPKAMTSDVIDLAGIDSGFAKRSELQAKADKTQDSIEQMKAELEKLKEAQDSGGFWGFLGGLFGADGGIIMGPLIGTSIGKPIGSSDNDDDGRAELLKQSSRYSWKDPD